MAKKVYIGADHAGYALKEKLKAYFLHIEWVDLGTNSEESVDYPDVADRLAIEMRAAGEEQASGLRGLLICGSGQGMAMRANKYSFLRAALCYDRELVKLAVEHNDANVLCLGARFVSSERAIEMVKEFMTAAFLGGRHQRRVDKLGEATK